MISLPLDPSLTLIALSESRLAIKNQQTGEIAIDRESGQKVYQLDVAMTVDGGKPMTFTLSVPESGLSDGVALYTPFRASGLVFQTGEMNGRTWQKFKAVSIAPATQAA